MICTNLRTHCGISLTGTVGKRLYGCSVDAHAHRSVESLIQKKTWRGKFLSLPIPHWTWPLPSDRRALEAAIGKSVSPVTIIQTMLESENS